MGWYRGSLQDILEDARREAMKTDEQKKREKDWKHQEEILRQLHNHSVGYNDKDLLY